MYNNCEKDQKDIKSVKMLEFNPISEILVFFIQPTISILIIALVLLTIIL